MKISKASWHYRFTQTYGMDGFTRRCEDGRHTTCSYIRAVIYAALRAVVAWSALAVVIAAMLSILASMVTIPVVILAGVVIVKASLLGGMVPLCVVGWSATVFGLLCYLLSCLGDVISARSERRQNLLAQMYKDKKDGVCTLVEVVE